MLKITWKNFLEFYLDNCERSKLVTSFTNATLLVTITISHFDIANNAFTGEVTSSFPWFMPGPVTGTIEEDRTGLITVTRLRTDIYFTLDSENCQLDLERSGIFSEDILPRNPYTKWKLSQYGIFSSPYFLLLGLNMDQKKLLV